MNRTHSEFDARKAARVAGRASVLVLALVLSACATKSSGLAGHSKGDARTAAAASGVSGQKSLKSTDSSSEALAGKAGASSLDANGSRRGDGSQAGRSDGAGSAGNSAGGPVDPMSGVIVKQVAGADGTGANGAGVMKSDRDRAALAADGEARSREAERLEAEARARTAAGDPTTAGAGASARAGAAGDGSAAGAGAGTRAGSSASASASASASGSAGEAVGQNGRDGGAAGADGAGGVGGVAGVGGADGAARAGSAKESGDSAKSTLAYADANDPVAAALARADAARARGDLDGSGNGTGSSSGKSGSGATAGAGASGKAGSQGANGDGADPVADALRRAEQALQDAKLAAEREAAERRGRVDTAGSNVKIEEYERQQTLDGMLPMALNMDERGLFEFDRYELRNEVKSTLDLLAEKLKSAEYDRLVILGYTDRIGTDDYNRQLSDKRAWAVAGYLMDRGVPPHKLKVEGRGERDSVTGDEACEGLKRAEMIQCLQRDRRVEIAATVKEYNLRVQ